jgi:MerR family transcriptional regulator, light-induced transcriptional regulator
MAGAIRTNAAAAMLGVSASTLRSWERRFGFPAPQRSAGGHRQYDLAEVEALRSAFEQTGNVSSAVSIARERGAGPATDARLRAALLRFEEPAADRLLEESMAMRSLERTVGEVLLPAVAGLPEGSAELAFGWRWAARWLSAAMRLSPPATREAGVLLLEATTPLDLDALRAQALELALRRAGLRTLALGAGLDPARMTCALAALAPRAVVVCGTAFSLDALGRIVFAARRAGGEGVGVFDLGGALPASGASIVTALPADDPLAAREAVLAHVEGRPAVRAATA